MVLAKYYNAKQVPVRGKGCTSQQMPFLKEKFKKYNDFAREDLKGIFGKNIEASLHYQVTEFRSGIFFNEGNDNFSFTPFANEAQTAPINSIVYEDFDGDGTKDLLMAGNNHQSEVETTRADAGTGVFLKGSGGKEFQYISNLETGFFADRDVRAMALIRNNENKKLLVINNDSRHQLFAVNLAFDQFK